MQESERKQFFFEKKNQKTFICFSISPWPAGGAPNEQKFFVSFFQKRNTSFPSLLSAQ
jgi:hypothetical protein